MKHFTRPVRILLLLLFLTAAGFAIVLTAGKYFTSQESAVRSSWDIETDTLIGALDPLQIEIGEAGISQELEVLQLLPVEREEETFTFYDTAVQDRLRQAVLYGQEHFSDRWQLTDPLAILNPYGTITNGLYLYFSTDQETKVEYTITCDDETIPPFIQTAVNADGSIYSRTHEFQMMGLVPGETCHVILTLRGRQNEVRRKASFTVTMPETRSGYATRLEYVEGDSTQPVNQGLNTLMRTNGYLGYGFFFDQEGILRSEMMLEGYGLDRILMQEDGTMLTCVSAQKLAKMDRLGRVLAVYPLEGYELHHDIVMGRDNTAIALVDDLNGETVEDMVVEIDLSTGEVSKLVDFAALMEDFRTGHTYRIPVTEEFFWMAGEWDWLHLNTVQYLPEDDSLLVSSRECSTIIKVAQVHTQPVIRWMLGDPQIWAGTGYEELLLTQTSPFVYQYGQHSVEYAGAGESEGVYYIRLYNNNYWSISTRDLEIELPETVHTELNGKEDFRSQVYLYKVDENAGTVTLADSFDVPYSSIVSNAAPAGDSDHLLVNSGMAHAFGEYDAEGRLIRQYTYDCTMQGYRAFQYDLSGFWYD